MARAQHVLLVAEDDAAGTTIAGLLARIHAHVTVAAPGFRLHHPSGRPFDCVVIAPRMHRRNPIDGVLATLVWLEDVPVVAVVPNDHDRWTVRALSHGAHATASLLGLTPHELRRVISIARARWSREQHIVQRAMHDPLTGLPSRGLIHDRLVHALARAERDSTTTATLFVDVDAFKTINDMYGHLAGDTVLVAVSQRMASALRPSDTAGRYGGDEFVIVCEDAGGLAAARTIGRRVTQSVARPIAVAPDTALQPSLSVGVALAQPGDSPEDVIDRADRDMYAAKQVTAPAAGGHDAPTTASGQARHR